MGSAWGIYHAKSIYFEYTAGSSYRFDEAHIYAMTIDADNVNHSWELTVNSFELCMS